LAAGDQDGKIRLFDGLSGEAQAVLDHGGPVSRVAFSSESKSLASGGNDKTVKLWDVAEGKLRQTLKLEGNKGVVRAFAFSRDGRVFARGGHLEEDGQCHGEVILWDAKSGELKRSIPDLSISVVTLSFSPDGKTLALAGGPPLSGFEATGEFRLIP